MSIKSVGKICRLFISQKGSNNRASKKCLLLDTFGIREDKYHNTNIQRSVLITSLSSYQIAKKYHITMPFGSLGENLLIDYNPYNLPIGTQLNIGTAKIEISQLCTICEHLSSIDTTLPVLLKRDRGIFAKVIQEGEVHVGDSISIIGK